MKHSNRFRCFVLATILLLPVLAFADGQLASSCQAVKNEQAGRYMYCLQKAESAFCRSKGTCRFYESECYRDEDCSRGDICEKDQVGYERAVHRCQQKIIAAWERIEDRTSRRGGQCPTETDIDEILDSVTSWSETLQYVLE